MDSRGARVARGGIAAAVATFVAAFSHTLAGGVGPSVFGLGASLVISVAVCTVLAGRTLSIARLTASVAVSQLLFHSLFSGLGAPVVASQNMASHDMAAMVVDAPTHLHAEPEMWAAHSVAALVTVLALRFGERAFWGLADTARLLLARLLFAPVLLFVAPRTPRAADRRFLPRDLALLLSPMRHRGPPLEHAAA